MAILSWVFSQIRGENLQVNGFGTFNVEWHMATDVKQLSASKGATSKTLFIYCMHFSNHLDASNHTKASTHFTSIDASLKSILDILLSRVHIRTMHALHRIVENLFIYIRNLHGKRRMLCYIKRTSKVQYWSSRRQS